MNAASDDPDSHSKAERKPSAPSPSQLVRKQVQKAATPGKQRRAFGSVVKGGATGKVAPVSQSSAKGGVFHDDLTFTFVLELPDTCEVTSTELQDPALAQYYVGLPPLK